MTKWYSSIRPLLHNRDMRYSTTLVYLGSFFTLIYTFAYVCIWIDKKFNLPFFCSISEVFLIPCIILVIIFPLLLGKYQYSVSFPSRSRLLWSASLNLTSSLPTSNTIGFFPSTSLPISSSETTSPSHFAMKRASEVMAMVERYGVARLMWRKGSGRVVGRYEERAGLTVKMSLTFCGMLS